MNDMFDFQHAFIASSRRLAPAALLFAASSDADGSCLGGLVSVALGSADPNAAALPADVLATPTALAVGCLEARRSHPRIQRSYALYPTGACDRLRLHLTLAPRRLSIFVGLDGEYLEPFCKAERRASSPSPILPGSGYDSPSGAGSDCGPSSGST